MHPSVRNACFLASLVAAGPASALSCFAPTVAGSFGYADGRTAEFRVAVGSLEPEHYGTGPTGADPNDRQSYTVPAQFTGRFFNGAGFGGPQRQADITIEVICDGPWCGAPVSSDDGLFFFRSDANGALALEAYPCPIFVFHYPTAAQRAQVTLCSAVGC
jgi:hypothetical protein